jgi:uncharacterized membrane protein YheB (UPF0754 family)
LIIAAEAREGFVPYLVHHWYIALGIPIVAGLIGWVTKLVAIEMMFRPIEYVGRKPFGWQGIVPSRAARMASVATEMMTTNLISASEVISRLDPERVAKEIEVPLHDAIEDITREVATEFQPGLWESLPEAGRQLVIRRIQNDAPRMVKNILESIQADVDAVFDLKDMVVTNLVRDKALLNRIFREAGAKEFRFIARSGIYFGGSIGVIQMLLWAAFRQPLIMPAFGLGIGWFTDWLALKMIFNPRYPTRYFGFIEWQGLFLKRRHEVSAHYAALIADEIITPHKVIEAVLTGPLSDKIFVMIQRNVQELMDRQTGLARPLVVIAVGSSNYQRLKRTIAEKVMTRMPETMAYVEDYATDAMDIRNLLVEKMQQLTPEQFEGLIRPAFQQDEWILITVGAVLGFTVGEVQALILEHLAR